MLSLRLATLFVIACLLVSVAQAGKGKGRGKDKKGGSEDFGDLKKEVDALKARIEELEAGGAGDAGEGGAVQGPQLHVFFHKDHEHHSEERDGDVINVHVDLNHDDHKGDSSDSDEDDDHAHEAHCQFHGADENIDGFVHIIQQGDETHIHAMFEFLTTAPGDYGLHLHQNGDLSNGCESVGDLFEPGKGVSGDVGLLSPDQDGKVHAEFNETALSLIGHHSIIGRSLEIHGLDDTALACCVIGWSAEMDYAEHHKQHKGH